LDISFFIVRASSSRSGFPSSRGMLITLMQDLHESL
jgi:hypothetical protein